MNHRIAFALIVCGALMGAGCTSKPRDVALKDEKVSVMTQMNNILEGVKDVPSAKAAKPRLQELGKKMEAIQAKYGEVQPSPENKAAFEKEMQPLQQKLTENIMRIGMNPQLSAELQDAFDGMGPGKPMRK